MSLRTLQERLVQLQETTSQIRTLIDRLGNLKLQPGSVPLGDESDSHYDDGNVVAELGVEITQGLRDAEEELDLLREEVADLKPGRDGSEAQKDRNRLRESADRLGAELKRCRISFRKAQLSARQGLAAAQRAERAMLVASYAAPPPPSRSDASSPALYQQDGQQQQQQPPPPPPRRRHHQQKSTVGNDPQDRVVGAAHNVTSSLRRTHDLMAAELARSAYAAQALAESTAAMRELDQRYSGLDGMLAASRDLLGTLLRSQKSDTWYLQTALYMLLATAAWLVFRRLLYGPMWWFVWLPLRLLGIGVGSGASLVSKGLGGSGASMEVAGTAGSATVVDMGGAESVPTARVGGVEDVGQKEGSDPGSESEKVGKIIDEAKADSERATDKSVKGQDVHDESASDMNPKKRMWEEPEAAAKQAASSAGDEDKAGERVKDEL
ncbi:hypothetical protein PpBr36_01119 [Pyricularia pennisetigena]|uniref:hypothetical protein n=1 Tax=Pyricularia pennisetigena TaxID=1578925 RepID=UPI00115473E1|nr:hypothetical protein PpBr36_01119 [Pyricularia pennisetigena]TLS29510.1 hypothetical protein PpBr36_01119 [Pyricularia pennisetigena]